MIESVECERWRWLQAVASHIGPADPTTRLVLMTLSLHMDQTGDNAWPSQKTLARRSGLNERSVRKHLDRAWKDGWLKVYAKKPNGKGWRLHEYVAAVPADLEEHLEAHPWELDSTWRRAAPDSSPSDREERSAAANPCPAMSRDTDGAERSAHGAEPGAHRAERGDNIVRHHVPLTLPSDSSKDSPMEGSLTRTPPVGHSRDSEREEQAFRVAAAGGRR